MWVLSSHIARTRVKPSLVRLKSNCMDKIVPSRAPEKVTGQKANELRFPCCHTPRHFFSPRSCFIFASPEVSRNRGGAWGRQVAKSMQYPLAHSPLVFEIFLLEVNNFMKFIRCIFEISEKNF